MSEVSRKPATPSLAGTRQERLRDLEETVRQLRTDREYLLYQAELLTAEVDRLQAHVAEVERGWSTLHASLVDSASWRLTRPLRAIAALRRGAARRSGPS